MENWYKETFIVEGREENEWNVKERPGIRRDSRGTH